MRKFYLMTFKLFYIKEKKKNLIHLQCTETELKRKVYSFLFAIKLKT
jgi:hypothetical protein